MRAVVHMRNKLYILILAAALIIVAIIWQISLGICPVP
jgi:biotin transporter BioY